MVGRNIQKDRLLNFESRQQCKARIKKSRKKAGIGQSVEMMWWAREDIVKRFENAIGMDAASYLVLSKKRRETYNSTKMLVYDQFAFAAICEQLGMEEEEFEDLTVQDTDDRYDVNFKSIASKLQVCLKLTLSSGLYVIFPKFYLLLISWILIATMHCVGHDSGW